jgi:hypothetical protein
MDTGNDPGSLALMAYTLDELYHECKDTRQLTHAAYKKLGGVKGAIGKRSEVIFAQLSEKARAALPVVFRELVEVDERGTATRKREVLSKVASDDNSREMVMQFIDARLLVSSQDINNQPYIEVSHEALLRSWDRLAAWIENTQDDLRLLRLVRLAAADWERSGRRDDYLWSHERLEPVYEMQHRQGINFTSETVVNDFIVPESERLLSEFLNELTPEYRRQAIVDRWINIGESALSCLITAHQVLSNEPSLYDEELAYNISEIIRNADDYEFCNTIMYMLLSNNNSLRDGAMGLLSDPDNLDPDILPLPTDGVIGVLIDSLKDQNVGMRCLAAQALGNIGDPTAAPPLVITLQDQDGDVRYWSAFALGNIGDPSAVKPLINLLRDEIEEVRIAAANALGSIEDSSTISLLREAMENGDADVRYWAIQALGNTGDEDAIKPLAEALKDVDPNVRKAAMYALYDIGTPRAIAIAKKSGIRRNR